MDIQSAENSFKDVTYGEASYHELLNQFQELTGESYHLCLLIGERKKLKQKAAQQIAEKSGLEIHTVDANDFITQIESECKENIDKLFENFDPAKQVMHLKSGSRLSGVYTGHTLSRVKYATPQERYLLKKIQEAGGLYIIEMDYPNDAERTIRRAAQSIINFPPPKSGLQKMLWNLKHIRINGSTIDNKRPERTYKPHQQIGN